METNGNNTSLPGSDTFTEGNLPTPAGGELRALLLDLKKEAEVQSAYAKAQSRASNLRLFLTVLILALLVAVCVMVIPPLVSTIDNINTCVAEIEKTAKVLEETDIAGTVENINTLILNANSALLDVTCKLDAAMTGLEDALVTVNSIDIEKLNSSIEALSAIMAPLSRLFGR